MTLTSKHCADRLLFSCVDRLTRWPAVPLNVTSAFWPGVVVVRATGLPSALMVLVTEVAFSRLTVAVPLLVPLGMASTVYVPVCARFVPPENELEVSWVCVTLAPSGP